MAPPTEAIAPDPETRFLLSVLVNCKELNLDTQGRMEAEGMSRKDKGWVLRFRRDLLLTLTSVWKSSVES